MNSYRSEATKSLLKGWLYSLPAFFLLSYCATGDFRDGIFPWLLAFGFVMLANVLFVLLFKAIILRTVNSATSQLKFAVISAAYAALAFTLLIGWVYFDQLKTYISLSACAATIGSIAGFTFHTAYCNQPANPHGLRQRP